MKGLKKFLYKSLSIAFLFIVFISFPVFAQDIEQIPKVESVSEAIPEYIAEAQWSTVEKLEKFLAEKNYEKALLCFSEKIRDKIKDAQNNDPNFLVIFFTQWTLDEENIKNYKENVFKGKASFIFDVNEQEWKINEF